MALYNKHFITNLWYRLNPYPAAILFNIPCAVKTYFRQFEQVSKHTVAALYNQLFEWPKLNSSYVLDRTNFAYHEKLSAKKLSLLIY